MTGRHAVVPVLHHPVHDRACAWASIEVFTFAADQNDARWLFNPIPERRPGSLNKRDRRRRCAGLPRETASSCRWVADRRASHAKHPEPRLADIGLSGRRGRTLGSTIHRTPTMKQKRSTSLKVPTPSTPTPLRQRVSDQAASSSFRLAPYTGSEPVQRAGDRCASGLRPSNPRSSVGLHTEQPTSSLRAHPQSRTRGRWEHHGGPQSWRCLRWANLWEPSLPCGGSR